jgi:hypothetical protein
MWNASVARTFGSTGTACAAAVVVTALAASDVSAQTVSRLKGRVTTERGEAIPNADVHVEAFYGYAAGTFAGQRLLNAKTDKKGEWNVLGLKSGVWLFEVTADGYMPESVALPFQLLTTASSIQSGMAVNWQLVLKPVPLPSSERGQILLNAIEAVRGGNVEQVRTLLRRVPEDADAEYLAGAARIALLARDNDLARTLFMRALERDPSSYRSALGIATTLVLARDFDQASRVFDAARNRTHDKDEIRFLTIALSDLATIKVR